MIFGTELSAGHHNEKFDFDESVMAVAVETLARVALNFPGSGGCNGSHFSVCGRGG